MSNKSDNRDNKNEDKDNKKHSENVMQYGSDYKKNHAKIIEELDLEGFIYNASFYEEIETYALNQESEILKGYQSIKEGEQYYKEYDLYKREQLNKNTDYLRAMGT